MNVAIFTRCLHNGGTERVITTLSRLWSTLGMKCVFFTMQPKFDGEFDHSCIAREHLDYERLDAKTIGVLHQKYGFDIAVFNGSWAIPRFKNAIKLVHTLKNVRVCVILHHVVNNWTYSLCNHSDYDMDAYMPMIDALVCVDPMQAIWWRRVKRETFFIPNPVADEMQGIHSYGHGRNIVWVGRPTDEAKRFQLALEAFVLIYEQCPDARLTVLGTITPKQKNRYLAFVPAEVRKVIDIVGYEPNVRDRLGKSALHIFTSLLEVTVPQVILEAQACGVPTVALRMPVLEGLSDSDGVVLADDAKKLADATIALLKNPERILKLGSAARQSVTEKATSLNLSGRWRSFFAVLEKDDGGNLLPYAEEHARQFETKENYDRLIRELRRGEGFFVAHHLPRILWYRKWKMRFIHLLNLLTHGNRKVSLLES